MLRALALLARYSGRWFLIWLALLLVQGALPACAIYLTKIIVDSIVAGASLQTILPELSIIVLIVLTLEVAKVCSSWIATIQGELVRDELSVEIYQKSAALDYSFYDSSEHYDRMYRARAEALERPEELLDNVGDLLESLVSLAALAGLLLSFGVLLPCALLLSAVPLLFHVFRRAAKEREFRVKYTEESRRVHYYDSLLTDRESAAEVRVFDLGALFISKYQDSRKRIRKRRLELAKEHGISSLAATSAMLVVSGTAVIWMLNRVLQGKGSMGELVLFYQVFRQGQSQLQGLLGNLGRLYANSLFLEDFFLFLEQRTGLKSELSEQKIPTDTPRNISFQNVSFRYSKEAPDVLDDVSFDIPQGGMLAIVGENGSGKSTLVKLLARLYEPTQGIISCNGSNIADVGLDNWRESVSTFFQEPMRYDATVNENIYYSSIHHQNNTAMIVEAAARAEANFFIETLEQQYEAMLGRWFSGGVELSVGQWKRLALARALFKKSGLLLLDEPTSSMDPWTEERWMKMLKEVTKNQTVVIVTHTFAAAAYADNILVLDAGRIVESGSHQELLAKNGKYATAIS